MKRADALIFGLLTIRVNPCGQFDQFVVTLVSLKMAERSEAKSEKRSFASKIKIFDNLTRSFASHS